MFERIWVAIPPGDDRLNPLVLRAPEQTDKWRKAGYEITGPYVSVAELIKQAEAPGDWVSGYDLLLRIGAMVMALRASDDRDEA